MNETSAATGLWWRKYLEENAGAADVELTRDYLARIEEITPMGAAGECYDEACRPLTGNTTWQGHR